MLDVSPVPIASWYVAVLVAVAALRIVELRLSAHHQAQLLAEGGHLVYETWYPIMVSVHIFLFLGSTFEVWLYQRPFLPWLGMSMFVVLVGCLVGRAWVWSSLGKQWNVQIMATQQPVVDSGPYRYVRHPNYTIVIGEMLAIPLMHTAYVTALLCSLANAFVLQKRIQQEEAVLFTRSDYAEKMQAKPRFLPLSLRG